MGEKEGLIDVFDETDYGKMGRWEGITNLMKSFDITEVEV